jgi:hypothetical protein
MALTLDPPPSWFVLSKSPMYMGLETDKYVIFNGYPAFMFLWTEDLSLNVAGNSFNFKWPSGSATMTLVAGTPDDSGTQVPIWVSGQSAAVYANLLVTYFKLNYSLSEYFNITWGTQVGDVYISIEAKTNDLEFDLWETSLTGTGYSIEIFDTPSPIQLQDNYKMFVDVYVETVHANALYEKVGTQELDPVDNICLFDISKMVNAKLSYQLPAFNETSILRNFQTMKRFYVRYAEKYGSPVAIKKAYETTPIEALKAGFNFTQFSNTYAQINSHYIANKLFLTRQPRTKKVSASQQEYLSFITPDTSTANVVMKVEWYFVDGSPSTQTTTAPISMGKKQLWVFPVGFNQIAPTLFPGNPFETISKYKVWIEGSYGGAYSVFSEEFTFTCDKDVYRDERFFLFTSSDGGIDTLRATGINTRTTSVEGDVLSTDIRKYPGYLPSEGEYKTANLLAKSTCLQNTGFLTKAQNKWLDDFFLAEKKWEVLDGTFVPIVLITKQKPYDESQSKPYSFDFEYSYAFDDVVTKSEQI